MNYEIPFRFGIGDLWIPQPVAPELTRLIVLYWSHADTFDPVPIETWCLQNEVIVT